MIALLLACAAPEPSTLPSLAPARLARRMSLDLRGVLPTEAELDTVEANPDALATLAETWMDDPRFQDRLVQLLQERWYTRVDTFDIPWYDYGLSEADDYRYTRAVGEEPLRIVARVVAEDRPWSEVVTADWTMTDDILAGLWPVDYPADAAGWQVTHYTDGRPSGGVLSTNGLWWRYTTNTSNMNRGRAAAISRLLLCEDPLARPVSLSFSDPSDAVVDPADAARTNPACLSCHASLDPVAASLFGFWWLNMYSSVEETTYHPERERLYTDNLGTSPAWFGTPIAGLSELGAAVARDPRLYRCAVQSFAEGLWRRDTTLADFDTIEGLRSAFVDGGAHPRALVRALLETPEYRAAADDAGENRTARLLTPDQLATAIEDLTGFRWTAGGADLLDSDTHGYRLLAGGVDGASAFSPQREPGLTWSLVVERLAQGAGDYAAQGLGETGLLAEVDPAWTPSDVGFQRAIARLHLRMYAEPADPEWAADVGALWTTVEAADGPESAWASVVAGMSRDPAFVTE